MEACRTVVVSGVPDVLPADRMADKLAIHFQSCRRSRGGDVEQVRYPSSVDGLAFVIFCTAEDAERVVRKERHIMSDQEFPEDYPLTVFPFTDDVFLYVSSAMVNLSVFGPDQVSLIQRLRSAHRSLRFQPLLQQRKAAIEGPFAAVKALREDLIRQAGLLKPPISAQTAAVKLRETALNPRVISHRESGGSVSCSGSKAKLEPASSNGLSTPLQSTGEGTNVQSLLSNAKTPNAFWKEKVSSGSLAAGSFCDRDSDEKEEPRARSGLEMPPKYRSEGAEADPARVLREEISAGIGSSLSGTDRLPAEEISAKHPGEDSISPKHTRPDRISGYLKESHESSSAVSAEFPENGLKNASGSPESDTRAICAEGLEDECIWLDSNIFRYIDKFDKKFNRHLRKLGASVEHAKEADLVRILLPEKGASQRDQIQLALEDLKASVEFWASHLRVHHIYYDEEGRPDKQRLTEICDGVNLLYSNVLYALEDSSVNIIGPSVSSHLFYTRVKEMLKETFVHP